MDLTLTSDQEAFVDAFGGFSAEQSPSRAVRQAEPLGHDPEPSSKAVAMGFPVIATPRATGGDGTTMLRVATDGEVAMLLGQYSAWVSATGHLSDVEAPMAMLFSSEALVRAADQLVEAVGPEALRQGGMPGAVVGGDLEHAFRQSVVHTIYAGSSEMQRNIIGQRGLGLPRS